MNDIHCTVTAPHYRGPNPEPYFSRAVMRILPGPYFVDFARSINRGQFELSSAERLSTVKSLPTRREEQLPKKAVPHDVSSSLDIVSSSLDIEQKSPTKPASGLRRFRALWPWAWLALAGIVTLAWAIAIGWIAVAVALWLTG